MRPRINQFTAAITLFVCCQQLFAQNFDAYITDSVKNKFVLIASSSNSLASPIDLDFYPNQGVRPMELWILSQGTNSTGGSTVIVTNPHKSTRTRKYVQDGNAWHFMALTSAMAYGDSNWATCQDILDANRQSGKYTGPTLWPGDMSIYGIVGKPSSQTVNGSHLSMVHQTPYGKGIAFEKDNIYWVMDGYEGLIKRYDFGDPHEPGGSDHSGGSARVFNDFTFTRHTTLPSHIVIDKARKYLYGCDPMGKRIFRIDITTGSLVGNRTKVNNEPMTGYYTYNGLQSTTLIDTGLTAPVGIDIFNDRLIVTDNGRAEIIIYDISSNIKEVGRIKLKYTATPDVMGIKVGPDGKLYFVDKANKQAYLIENASVPTLGISEQEISSFTIFPNPANSIIQIQSKNQFTEISIVNVLGETVYSEVLNTTNKSVDISTFNTGIYFIKLKSRNNISTHKIIKQ